MALDPKWWHAQWNLGWKLVVHYVSKLNPWRARFGIERFRQNYVHEGLPPASPALRALRAWPGKCTQCGACDQVCPLLAEPTASGAARFAGPMSFVTSGLRAAPHYRDVEDAARVLLSARCDGCRACDAACPEHIPISTLARGLLDDLAVIRAAASAASALAAPGEPRGLALPGADHTFRGDVMGATKGSASYLRFLITGDVPANPGRAYEESLEVRRFLPLHPDGESLEQAGWAPIDAPFADDEPITRDRFSFGDLIAVTYREDKYMIPRPVLQRRLKERLKQIEEGPNPPEKMNKGFVKAVEKAVLVELKRQTYPRTKFVDVIWDTTRGEARVFGRGTIVTERVASLFERTFRMRVELGSYAARAYAVDMPSRARAVLDSLSPGPLFDDDAAPAAAEVA